MRLSKIEVRCGSACGSIIEVRVCVRHTAKSLATQRLDCEYAKPKIAHSEVSGSRARKAFYVFSQWAFVVCRYKQILQARRLFSNKCSQVNNHDSRMKYLKSLGLCSIKLQRGYSSRMNRGLRSNFSSSRTKETPSLHFKSTSRHAWIKNKVHLPQTVSLQVFACYKTYLSF